MSPSLKNSPLPSRVVADPIAAILYSLYTVYNIPSILKIQNWLGLDSLRVLRPTKFMRTTKTVTTPLLFCFNFVFMYGPYCMVYTVRKLIIMKTFNDIFLFLYFWAEKRQNFTCGLDYSLPERTQHYKFVIAAFLQV